MEKANEGPFWPRLIKAKTKPHFIHVDFSRWVDENEDEDDPEANAPMDPNMFMNFAGAGAGAQFGDDTFEDAMEESSSDEEGKDLEMPALE
jgi:prostaglandin-E synthase